MESSIRTPFTTLTPLSVAAAGETVMSFHCMSVILRLILVSTLPLVSKRRNVPFPALAISSLLALICARLAVFYVRGLRHSAPTLDKAGLDAPLASKHMGNPTS